jgi:cobalt-zinc-cadmium efflux system outer membrane protein
VKIIRILISCALLGIFSLLMQCAPQLEHDRQFISDALNDKVGAGLVPEEQNNSEWSESVNLADGLSMDEAVATALWTNAQFQADLLQLGLAQADLIQAGMISNPAFSYLFPWGPKQLEATLSLPIEALWQRPYRVAMAKLSAEQVAENLVQNGLKLVLDVRTAYADLVLAQQLAVIAREEATLQQDVLAIAESRLKAGDTSELETIAIRMEATLAEENAIKLEQQADVALLHLTKLLGLILQNVELELTTDAFNMNNTYSRDMLLDNAYAARPDLRAAELAIESAGKKLGWQRSQIFNFTAVLDANGQGSEGFEMGPGFKLDLPLFNWNKGGRARAAVELEQAAKLYLAKKEEITHDVLAALSTYQAAQDVLSLHRTHTLSDVLETLKNAEKAYLLGELSYLEFIVFKRQVLNARVRDAEAVAQALKAQAQLFHAIGFSLSSPKN